MWWVAHVPSVEDEDQRHLHRELMTLKRERTWQINRGKGLLASQGLRIRLRGDFESQLDGARRLASFAQTGGAATLVSCLAAIDGFAGSDGLAEPYWSWVCGRPLLYAPRRPRSRT